jgi:phosphatidylglycerophosphatase A
MSDSKIVETKKPCPRWAWWIATGFGSGCVKPAPGTWGSLAGVLAWLIFSVLVLTPFTNWAQLHPTHPRLLSYGLAMEALQILAIVALTWVSVMASNRIVQETGEKDPSYIVADEWVGTWIALWPLRWIVAMNMHRFFHHGWWRMAALVALPFLFFRLFDIWKPWPIRQIQVLPEGQGIVADDVVAGLYALVLTVLLQSHVIARLGI